MYQLKSIINTIIQGNALEVLPQFPPNILDTCVTSPPYYGMRIYHTKPQVWGGDTTCDHDWNEVYKPPQGGKNLKDRPGNVGAQKNLPETDLRGTGTYSNVCIKCGAWSGSLGLEPQPSLYISHLCDIFDEVMRVMKSTGTLWVNLGDTYSTHASGSKNYNHNFRSADEAANEGIDTLKKPSFDMGEKSLLCIPDMFKIEMVRRGWICRNDLIWYKKNCMPQSSDDRFTVDYERIFFFVKSSDTQYYTNEKTLQLTTKQPLGTKGIEGVDWDWAPCPQCREKKEENTNGCIDEGSNESTKTVRCPRCNGIGKIQKSLWSGHDYYFEQQFEPYTEPPNRWGGSKLKAKQSTLQDKTTWDNGTGQMTYRDRSLRPNDLGRNKRSVWQIPEPSHEVVVQDRGETITISQSELKLLWELRQNRAHGSILDVLTKPNSEAHFAVFPEELIHTPIIAGSPEHVCMQCGMPKHPVVIDGERIQAHWAPGTNKERSDKAQGVHGATSVFASGFRNTKKEAGYAHCDCNAGWAKGIVLDQFMGAGTTALKARKEERDFIGIELNEEYIKIANKLLSQKTIESWKQEESA